MLQQVIAALVVLSMSGMALQSIASDVTISQLGTVEEVRELIAYETARLKELIGIDVWESEEDIMETMREFEKINNASLSLSSLDETYRLDDYALTPAAIMGVSEQGIEELEVVAQKL